MTIDKVRIHYDYDTDHGRAVARTGGMDASSTTRESRTGRRYWTQRFTPSNNSSTRTSSGLSGLFMPAPTCSMRPPVPTRRFADAQNDDAAAVATSSELMAVYVEAPCWFRVGSVLTTDYLLRQERHDQNGTR